MVQVVSATHTRKNKGSEDDRCGHVVEMEGWDRLHDGMGVRLPSSVSRLCAAVVFLCFGSCCKNRLGMCPSSVSTRSAMSKPPVCRGSDLTKTRGCQRSGPPFLAVAIVAQTSDNVVASCPRTQSEPVSLKICPNGTVAAEAERRDIPLVERTIRGKGPLTRNNLRLGFKLMIFVAGQRSLMDLNRGCRGTKVWLALG